MNERIRELAEQANLQLDNLPDDTFIPLENFAELIVRECCDWIDGSPATDAGQLLLTKSFIIANLKGHFGVEE